MHNADDLLRRPLYLPDQPSIEELDLVEDKMYVDKGILPLRFRLARVPFAIGNELSLIDDDPGAATAMQYSSVSLRPTTTLSLQT